jgi:hypothetical protein
MPQDAPPQIDFATEPSRYRRWRLVTGGPVAELVLDVDESAGLFEGYELKLTPMTSASTSSFTTRCSACASSIRRPRR